MLYLLCSAGWLVVFGFGAVMYIRSRNNKLKE